MCRSYARGPALNSNCRRQTNVGKSIVLRRCDSGTLTGPGGDSGGTRPGPGRDPGGTRGHRSAKLRSDGGPWGPGVQLGSSPHARTAHRRVARRSWGTERCAGPSQSGCNGSRSLLIRVPAGSRPGPSRVPNRVEKKHFARSTRCFGASKPSNNDAEPWLASLLHCAPSRRAPHSLNLSNAASFVCAWSF